MQNQNLEATKKFEQFLLPILNRIENGRRTISNFSLFLNKENTNETLNELNHKINKFSDCLMKFISEILHKNSLNYEDQSNLKNRRPNLGHKNLDLKVDCNKSIELLLKHFNSKRKENPFVELEELESDIFLFNQFGKDFPNRETLKKPKKFFPKNSLEKEINFFESNFNTIQNDETNLLAANKVIENVQNKNKIFDVIQNDNRNSRNENKEKIKKKRSKSKNCLKEKTQKINDSLEDMINFNYKNNNLIAQNEMKMCISSNEENLNEEFLLKTKSSTLQYSLEKIEVEKFFISEKTEEEELQEKNNSTASLTNTDINTEKILYAKNPLKENVENTQLIFRNFLNAIEKDNYNPISSLQKINLCNNSEKENLNNINLNRQNKNLKDKENDNESSGNSPCNLNKNFIYEEINKIKSRKISTISNNFQQKEKVNFKGNSINSLEENLELKNLNQINDSTGGDFDREISSAQSFSNSSDLDLKIIKKKNKLLEKYKPYIPEKILNDPSSNFNFYRRQFIPKNIKKSEKFKNSIPFLKEFNPKFLKKENIDKKILRKFRNFVKFYLEKKNLLKFSGKLKKKEINLNESGENIIENLTENKFVVDFYKKNLLPPMKYSDYKNNITIEFKSFNTNYMLWLFSQKNMKEVYNLFAENFGSEILNEFIEAYDLDKINKNKEIGIIEMLRNYILSIGKIYKSEEKIENKNVEDFKEIEKEEIEENKNIEKEINGDNQVKDNENIKMQIDSMEKKKTSNKKNNYSIELFDNCIEDIIISNQTMILDFNKEDKKINFNYDFDNKNGRKIIDEKSKNYFYDFVENSNCINDLLYEDQIYYENQMFANNQNFGNYFQ